MHSDPAHQSNTRPISEHPQGSTHPRSSTASLHPRSRNESTAEAFRRFALPRVQACTAEYRSQEQAALARLARNAKSPAYAELHLEGTLTGPSLDLLPLDEDGAARLSKLDARLELLLRAFPQVETEITMCRLACTLVEEAWHTRARQPADPVETDCTCRLCNCLPTPPPRNAGDYAWRRSEGRPLTVRPWPQRHELDSVLTGGWNWTRQLNDLDKSLGYRFRFEDDILLFHEYKRVLSVIDIEELTQRTRQRLGHEFDRNSARALVGGLFAAHKRSVDEYWLKLHRQGAITLQQATPLDRTTYTLLQLMDCLFWHVSPDSELWQEEHLATLVLCRVLDDMTDARVDSLTGEISSLWLASMPTHDKALHAAAAVALVKYSCMPESHGDMWNSWLMPTTIVWMGLNGRHPLWFDGIAPSLPPADECPLCDLQSNACTTLLLSGTNLTLAPSRPAVALSPHSAELSDRCRAQSPRAWPTFHAELQAFEALHGAWQGEVDTVWEILRRTYVAAVDACMGDASPSRPLEVQRDAGAVGAELFHTLHHPQTGREDAALLAYMYGCAHPHFLWNAMAYRPSSLDGDWLDG
jgi:hypothetical protein